MKKFLRDNLLIVVSIALPMLVAAFFVLASTLPKLYTAPPSHDLLLVVHGPGLERLSPVHVELAVSDQRLRVQVVRFDTPQSRRLPRIFRYIHEKDSVREIVIPVPEDIDDLPDGSELVVPELSGLLVDGSLRAPDGYVYRGRKRSRGTMLGLFGGNRWHNDVMIEKDGALWRIPLPATDYWYGEPRFVGWVTGRRD